MVSSSEQARRNGPATPPLARDESGAIDLDSVPDVIQWFIDYDDRVAVIRHPRVEEVFQWKQQLTKSEGEDVFVFNCAEDRLAIGIIQALAENSTRAQLHAWIGQLLNALDTATKANEATAERYNFNLTDAQSIVVEAEKIPSTDEQREFLLNCWIESLCTAEARILGWLFQEFYGERYAP